MSEPWKRTTLGDLVTIAHGWPFKSEEFSEELSGRPIVVAVGNFRYEGGFRFDTTTTKEYRGDYPESYELTPGDTLLIMTCQTPGGEILGIPARVPNDGRKYLHNQRLGKVVVREPELIDDGFLYHLFRSRNFNSALCATASGSKILHTAPKRIEAYEFFRPPIETQRAIAAVLGALDDKIEQNRRTERALEKLARATFKAWFVDFEPVKAKAVGQTSFPGMPATAFAALPDCLTDSPLGPLPAGWHSTDLGREFDFQVGFAFKSAQFTDASDAVRLVRGDNVKEGWIEWGTKTRRWNDLNEKVNSYKLAVGDVVIGMDGSKLGKNWSRVRKFDLPSLLVQRVARFRSTGDAGPSLLWLVISHPTFREFVDAVKTGTSIPHISGGQLKSFSFLKPSNTAKVVWSSFEEAVGPLLSLADHAEDESAKLADLRDYLLPRLLSGRVRVRDVDALARASR